MTFVCNLFKFCLFRSRVWIKKKVVCCIIIFCFFFLFWSGGGIANLQIFSNYFWIILQKQSLNDMLCWRKNFSTYSFMGCNFCGKVLLVLNLKFFFSLASSVVGKNSYYSYPLSPFQTSWVNSSCFLLFSIKSSKLNFSSIEKKVNFYRRSVKL